MMAHFLLNPIPIMHKKQVLGKVRQVLGKAPQVLDKAPQVLGDAGCKPSLDFGTMIEREEKARERGKISFNKAK